MKVNDLTATYMYIDVRNTMKKTIHVASSMTSLAALLILRNNQFNPEVLILHLVTVNLNATFPQLLTSHLRSAECELTY